MRLGFWGSIIYARGYWDSRLDIHHSKSLLVMFSKSVMINPSRINRFLVVEARHRDRDEAESRWYRPH